MLKSLATETLRSLPKTKAEAKRTESLLDFVPRITPRWDAPHHLAAIVELFERAHREGNIFACISVPPQHGKTELILHGIAWWLSQRPEDTVGYASYSAEFAHSKSRLARDYAREAGVTLRDDSQALKEWRTTKNGGLLATGIGGPLTGHALQLLIVDDPLKNRQDAESATERNTVHQWFQSAALTRLHDGGSCIVVHTRWHPDDLIGRLESDRDVEWEVINLPAIGDDGNALWPQKRSREFLEKKRKLIGEYEWSSLYQGRPRPRGGSVFNGAHYYDDAPTRGYRTAIGVDLAYTARTSADYSVSLVVAKEGDTFYVLDVIRRQVQAPEFGLALKSHASQYRGSPMRWYCSGTEKGVAQFLRDAGIPIEPTQVTADKFGRAQPVAAAWNNGRVLVPRDAPWLPFFLDEVLSFTGVSDAHDDMVDALAAAFDAVNHAPGTKIETVGRRTSSGLKGYY